jgi:serine/threonine protein kinase
VGDEERPVTNSAGGAGADAPYDANTTDLVGHLLADRYRIIAKLGEGAMGTVYLGEHLRMGRRDAIKVLRPSFSQDQEAIARFTRGTRNVSAIRHPNVCTIYDFSDTPEGVRYLAMEYIEGDTLKEVLDREGRLTPQRAVNIACQVADALQAGHDVGVIHRDLKPGNIMLCRSTRPGITDVVKVVDFDISKGAGDGGEEVTRTGFVVGTPEYMSPEQLIGERLDGRSDLYSLGVVLFRLLTGRLPFRAENTQDMMLERLTGTPMRLDEAASGAALPPGIQRALDRALARKAVDRQASVAEFGQEIAAALKERAVEPVAPPKPVEATVTPTQAAIPVGSPRPIDSPPITVKKRPSAIVLLAGLVIIAAIGGGVAWSRRSRAPQIVVASHDSSRTPADSSPPPIDSTRVIADTTASTKRDTVADSGPRRDSVPLRSGGTSKSGSPGSSTKSGMSAAALSAMLDRQLDALSGTPSAAVLRAARDSAAMALRLTTVRHDSVTAALVLAQAALSGGNTAECAKWARLGASLGAAGFDPLLQACR